MSKADNRGFGPISLISLAMVLGVFLVTAIPLIISVNEINSGAWISLCGSVIGSCVSVFAVVVAVMNVRRQLRVNLLSREEERIENDLPGLNAIVSYIRDFRRATGAVNVYRLHLFTAELDREPLPAMLRARIPHADINSVHQLQTLMEHVLWHAQAASRAHAFFLKSQAVTDDSSAQLDDTLVKTTEDMRRFQLSALQNALDQLRDFESHTVRKIELYERRLPRFRREIEEFFGDE